MLFIIFFITDDNDTWMNTDVKYPYKKNKLDVTMLMAYDGCLSLQQITIMLMAYGDKG